MGTEDHFTPLSEENYSMYCNELDSGLGVYENEE